MLSLGITVSIIIIVEIVKYRLFNIAINKINKTIVQAFSVFYMDEEVNTESIKKFNVYVTQRLNSFKYDKRISKLEIKFEGKEKVKINYVYVIDHTKQKVLSFEIVKK